MTLLPWRNYQVQTDKGYTEIHVVPKGDIGEHQLCEHCSCAPDEDAVTPDLWNHNAFDNREHYEQGAKLH